MDGRTHFFVWRRRGVCRADCLPDSRPEQLRTPKSCRGKKGLSTAFCSGPSKEVGRTGGRASPKVARDLPLGSRNSCRFWRVRRLKEGGHHGGRVGPSVAHARLAAAVSLLSSKKSIFLSPPSFPLSLYPTLSSLAELRLSLDMTADKGDGQRRRAILLGTFGRAEIVQCQSRKKFSRGNPKKLFLASLDASPTPRRKTKVRPGGTTPGTNANVVRSVVIQCECECEGLREGGRGNATHASRATVWGRSGANYRTRLLVGCDLQGLARLRAYERPD